MAKGVVRALALDTGFAHTGMVLAEIDTGKPSGFTILRVGCVHTDDIKKRYGKMAVRDMYKTDLDLERAGYIYSKLKEFLNGTAIDLLVSESPNSGGKSAIAIRSMGIATGVLGVIVSLMPSVHFVNFQPDYVKRAIGGSSTSGKEGVARAVRANFSAYAWPDKKRDAEHILDAAGALLACRNTDIYKSLANGGAHGRSTL
jgi:Holliday junction resolvasome RuvABC endonuclease subunit